MDKKFLNGIEIKECVGCGYCCVKAPCSAAQRIHGYNGLVNEKGLTECPELQWDGSRHVCRLMTLPDPLGFEFRQELYAGEGCCASLFNSWRDELKDRRPPKKKEVVNPISPEFQDFLYALGSEWISGDVIYLMCYKFKDLLIKRGYSKEDADIVMKKAMYYIRENRSKKVVNFMG